MKKLFLIGLLLVVCINVVNAQWVCDKTYWGDKYAYNVSKNLNAFFRIGEYWERETFLGTAAHIPLCLIEKKAVYSMDGKYFKISFLVAGVQVDYLLEASLSQEIFPKIDMASYTLTIERRDRPLFWKHFMLATKMTIRYNVIGIDTLYEFDMSGSAKAYTHVMNGKVPAWDKPTWD